MEIGNKPSTSEQSTYRVEFNRPSFDLVRDGLVVRDNILKLEDAVRFALSLHDASNVPHTVQVRHDEIIDVVFIGK